MDQSLIVDLKHYKKKKRIGIGGFGQVSLIEKIRDSKLYVAKESHRPFNQDSDEGIFFREVMSLTKVNNPAILTLHGISYRNFSNQPKPIIILDYMKNGSLVNLIGKAKSNPNYTKTKLYLIILGTALGMKYLHSLGIIHRDIKPENILLDDQFYPKIGDFGSSIISDKDLSLFQIEKISGTKSYIAPEILLHKPYTYKVDVYSFALVVYELITNEKAIKTSAYYNPSKSEETDEKPDLSKIENEVLKSFFEKCFSSEPEERPSFSEIVQEIMQDDFKEFFEVDQNEVNNYLDLFDKDLINPDRYSDLDINKPIADFHDREAIRLMAIKYFYGIGIEVNKFD